MQLPCISFLGTTHNLVAGVTHVQFVLLSLAPVFYLFPVLPLLPLVSSQCSLPVPFTFCWSPTRQYSPFVSCLLSPLLFLVSLSSYFLFLAFFGPFPCSYCFFIHLSACFFKFPSPSRLHTFPLQRLGTGLFFQQPWFLLNTAQ